MWVRRIAYVNRGRLSELVRRSRKMTDSFEREARNAQEMHKLQRKMANENSPAKKC